MKVGLVYDPIYLAHDTGHHVESVQRLEAVMGHLNQIGMLERLALVSPEEASEGLLTLVHTPEHVASIRRFAEQGGGALTADTVMSSASYKAACFAVGGLVKGVDLVMTGQLDSVFALVRPPGHHATSARAMGFCLFNNVALAAKHAKCKYGLQRILIADFDVHHGNGTQEAFYSDPGVLYFSVHEYPFYPGTGGLAEIGAGLGTGYTVNVPLPAWSSGLEYLRAFEEVLVPVARRFQPQLILVSAGYDAHWADEMSLMQLSVRDFGQMVGILRQLADNLCGGKVALVLEGGYHPQALAHSVETTLAVLLGERPAPDPLGLVPAQVRPPSVDRLFQIIKELHRLV